ncbi:hypothetical protein GCM10023206_08810 [Acinetobacter puyangensis]
MFLYQPKNIYKAIFLPQYNKQMKNNIYNHFKIMNIKIRVSNKNVNNEYAKRKGQKIVGKKNGNRGVLPYKLKSSSNKTKYSKSLRICKK